ncbi:MAG: hypothetical protein IJ357_00975 [Oscillospiraceae bacterium]|nr:hypothetical protein [Oscillospiraceae bacterium]
MLFRKRRPLSQTSTAVWKAQWQALVPPECRDVPITVDGETVIAYICIRQFVVMLQDGLLMEEAFFPVAHFFQRAGYHLVWLMRCTQDIHNGYLKPLDRSLHKWLWKSPTTNFGRWTSDNYGATILLQHEELPPEGAVDCGAQVLQRVTWAESDDASRMVPGRTRFLTVPLPGTPAALQKWLNGCPLNKLKE